MITSSRSIAWLLVVCAVNVWGQAPSHTHGYLGKRNVLSISVQDAIWADAISISYLHCTDRSSGVRVDVKLFHVDRGLVYETPGWLDIGRGREIGAVTGNGWAIGIYSASNMLEAISAPLGYYVALGVEHYRGSTIEVLLAPLGRESIMEGPPLTEFGYEHIGWRIMYDCGVRHIITSGFLVDMGVQFGFNFHYKVKTLGHDQMAIHRFPYERTGFYGKPKNRDFGVFKPRHGIFLNPMLRLGWVF